MSLCSVIQKTTIYLGVALAALVLTLTPSLSAWADGNTLPALRDASSIRSAGMGDATRGLASSDEALWVNPAGMASTPRFNLAASATFEVPKNYGLQLYSLNAIDSILNADTVFPLGGGVSYTYYSSGWGDRRTRGSVVLAGLSLPLVHESFTIGLTGKWFKLDGANKTNAVTMDVGLMVRPIKLLSIGATGYNLIDVHSVEAQRSWGFGLALGTDDTFHIAADAKLEKNLVEDKWKVSWFAGGEIMLGGMFMPRIGYTWDALRETHKVGGGLSVFAAGLAFEAAYQYLFEGAHYFGFAIRLTTLG